MKNEIKLGDKVKDPISGIIGIAVGRTVWLHGCARVIVQPEGIDKNKKPYESSSFDEPQLVVMKSRVVKEGGHRTGGPRPEVFQRAGVMK